MVMMIWKTKGKDDQVIAYLKAQRICVCFYIVKKMEILETVCLIIRDKEKLLLLYSKIWMGHVVTRCDATEPKSLTVANYRIYFICCPHPGTHTDTHYTISRVMSLDSWMYLVRFVDSATWNKIPTIEMMYLDANSIGYYLLSFLKLEKNRKFRKSCRNIYSVIAWLHSLETCLISRPFPH